MAIENQSEHKSKSWREFIVHETFEYYFNFAFLAVFLVAFGWYRRLILASYHISYTQYWMPLIEAAILAKVIMVGDALRVGKKFQSKPLAVVVVYRSVVFSIFVGLFTCLEHIVEALIHGKPAMEGIEAIENKGAYEILGSCVMIFTAFIPFFAMKEVERVFGTEKVRSLFFRRRTDAAGQSSLGDG